MSFKTKRKAIAVIGAGYGDEGKGLMTDYFSSQYDDAVVIRSNGGAQAGHTVVTPEGNRHVFSHFGSGTFNGTPTFLSNHFVVNPILFVKEHKAFVKDFGITPKIYIDGGCLVTTPYEMLLNQTHEAMRGNDVHGSCGVGFGETIERQLVHDSLLVADVRWFLDKDSDSEDFGDHLQIIRDEYVPTRVNLNEVNDEFIKVLNSDILINDFIEACRYMLDHTEYAQIETFEKNTLIFEAAQGLLLDMDYGYFPHVTRSNCGMKNINNLLGQMWGVEHDLTVNYVTRAYTTRHGAGPLYLEESNLPHKHNIVDSTNIHNEFQGSLRFAPLDMCLFDSVTDKDFLNYAPRGSKKIQTVTCMDQLDRDMSFIQNGERLYISRNVWEEITGQVFDYASYGPTKEDVKQLDK